MSDFRGFAGRAALALGAIMILGAGAPAPRVAAQQSQLPALSRLEPGLWRIREFGNDRATPTSICIADAKALMQLQHRQSSCSRLVITNETDTATVHYTCAASGFGHTSLRVETSHLAKIDTQGIVGNVPFAYRAEARWVGPCDPRKTSAR